jgi:hypothetical protein
MPYDYTDAPPPRDIELVPHGTVATVTIKIRAGGAGEDGLPKRSRAGDCEMLDLELTVVDGPYSRRKFWENLVLVGTTKGQQEIAESNRGRLKTILDSARNIHPDDKSPQARAARTADLKDFDGLNFIAKIGVEKGKPKNDGSGDNYSDKNILAAVITPDRKEWHPVEQAPPFNGGGGPSGPSSSGGAVPNSSAPPITKPVWAS